MGTTITTERHGRAVGFRFGQTSVGHELIRVVQSDGKKDLSAAVGQWEIVIAYFKKALEIPLCLDSSDEELKQEHRTMLLGLMARGEMLVQMFNEVKPGEESLLGYSREFVHSNLRYLRETYECWYVERDDEAVEAVWDTIQNARDDAAK